MKPGVKRALIELRLAQSTEIRGVTITIAAGEEDQSIRIIGELISHQTRILTAAINLLIEILKP
jgi:hypothetical protein